MIQSNRDSRLPCCPVVCRSIQCWNRSVDHRLDGMAIGINDERRIVVLAIVRAEFRNAVVTATVTKRGLVKQRHRLPGRRGECQMKSITWNCRLTGPEFDGKLVASARRAVAHSCRIRPHTDITQRRQRGIVESCGAIQIRNTEGQVVKHAPYAKFSVPVLLPKLSVSMPMR